MSSFLDFSYKPHLRKLALNTKIAFIIQIIGNGFALIYFLSPLFQILKKKLYVEKNMKNLPLLLILSIIFNCLFWLLNAFCSDNLVGWIPLLISNIGGLAVNTFLVFFYLFFFLEKDKKKFLGYSFFVVNLMVEITYLIYRYVIDIDKDDQEKSTNNFHLIGFVATIINVFMYSSPLQNIKLVIKEGKYEAIPIYTILSGFLATITFFIYGILSYCNVKEDEINERRNAIETMISNGVSILVLGCLSGVYAYFYFKPQNPEITPKDIDTIDNNNMEEGLDQEK